MKNIIKYIAAVACMGALVPAGMTSCTDMGGDGVDSVIWNGSQNPDNTSFHNPVIEPSLEAGTVVKGASTFVAISSTTQWAKGLTNYCPTLTTTNLMNWTVANDAFEKTAIPSWNDSRVNSLSIDYAKTIKICFWMFYTLEGGDGIGYAFSTSGQGPYTDKGVLLTAADAGATTIKNPFFIVAATNYYLCYTTENGTYIQKITLKGAKADAASAALSGTRTLIGNANMDDVAIFRKSSSELYLMFTVKNGANTEIRYARAGSFTGPYLDKSGNDVATTSNGELLIEGGDVMINPENPMRAFMNSDQTHVYVAYNATEAGTAQMKSGFARKPMLITPIELGDDGWFKSSVKAQKGWTSPRYE